MDKVKIIAIGDNVADKYLSRGIMYPGGQCVNTCVYAKMNDTDSAYLGKFGNDAVAAYNCEVLEKIGVDNSHSRHFEGENGYAKVTLENNDRVFLGSNKGGIAKDHPFDFTKDDLEYIKGFSVIYTNLNSYIEKDLPLLKTTGVPVAYDFSTRWNDDYLKEVCPYIDIATLSCCDLTDEQREIEMKKVQALGVKIILGTNGEKGSYALYKDKIFYHPAVKAEKVLDTMGAGDSYFAAFLVSMLKTSKDGKLISGSDDEILDRVKNSMEKGAAFAAEVCQLEGAFGYGIAIV
ncbi:MAG: fructoselysine 6-kinase [Herbinix sp.]|nr:fructoselysine 6-kinase [Herbinix sp.]